MQTVKYLRDGSFFRRTLRDHVCAQVCMHYARVFVRIHTHWFLQNIFRIWRHALARTQRDRNSDKRRRAPKTSGRVARPTYLRTDTCFAISSRRMWPSGYTLVASSWIAESASMLNEQCRLRYAVTLQRYIESQWSRLKRASKYKKIILHFYYWPLSKNISNCFIKYI